MAKGDIICRWECEGCAAAVNLKETEKGKAYYICGGEIDDNSCSHRAFFGAGPTRRIIRETQEENEHAETSKDESEAEDRPEIEAEPEGKSEEPAKAGDGIDKAVPDPVPGKKTTRKLARRRAARGKRRGSDGNSA